MHSVIVGCSFAGLECAHRLARRARGRDRVTVIDVSPTHVYVPLLHEVVSGVTPLGAIAFDVAAHWRAVGACFVRAMATAVDLRARSVMTDCAGTIAFDRLIVATGATGARPTDGDASGVVHARAGGDAAELMRRVREARARDARRTRVVVVGGGITGVEWAAELASTGIDGRPLDVVLVSSATRLVAELCAGVAAHALRRLESLGVEILLGRRATPRADDMGPFATTDDGLVRRCDVIAWAAGIAPIEASRSLGLPRTERGALAVDGRLCVLGASGVHAIGDAIEIVPAGMRQPARRAIEAMHQARYVARSSHADEPRDYAPLGTFPYGLSLGGRHSAIVYGNAWFVASPNAAFRRVLCRGYHLRYRLGTLHRIWSNTLGRRSGVAQKASTRHRPSTTEDVPALEAWQR